MKNLASTAFYLQTNGQVERYNETLESRLRLYNAENQQTRDIFEQPVMHAYNCQVHPLTNETSLSLTFFKHPFGPTRMFRPLTLADDEAYATDPKVFRQMILHQFAVMWDKVSHPY